MVRLVSLAALCAAALSFNGVSAANTATPAPTVGAASSSTGVDFTAMAAQNDITALQYALTLEHLEAAFYQHFQSYFNTTDVQAAGYNQYVYPNLALITAHETAHVQILSQVLTGLGASPVPACTYNFTAINSVAAYIAVAKVLENTGVSAYDGAVNSLTNINLKQAAATIATVEAKHAAYLNQLNAASPFPSAFDTAISPSQIVSDVLATGLVLSCPYPLATPIVLVQTVSPSLLRNYTSNQVSFGNSAPVNLTTPFSPLETSSYSRPLTVQEAQNDINVLNFALLLESTDSRFFAYGINKFTQQDFVNAGYASVVYGELQAITAHEQAHASALNSTILALGGTPLPACTYNFSSIQTVHDYFRVGRIFENTGVAAYDGGIKAITSTELQQIAATIATVESRHAAVLNGYNGLIPFPNVTDPTLTPPEVIELVMSLGVIVSCPFNVTQQGYNVQVLPTAGTINSADVTSTTGGAVAGAGAAGAGAGANSGSTAASGTAAQTNSTNAAGNGNGSASSSTGSNLGNGNGNTSGSSGTNTNTNGNGGTNTNGNGSSNNNNKNGAGVISPSAVIAALTIVAAAFMQQ